MLGAVILLVSVVLNYLPAIFERFTIDDGDLTVSFLEVIACGILLAIWVLFWIREACVAVRCALMHRGRTSTMLLVLKAVWILPAKLC